MCEIYYTQQHYYVDQISTSRLCDKLLVELDIWNSTQITNIYQKNDPISGHQLPVSIRLLGPKHFNLEWGYHRPLAAIDDIYDFVRQNMPGYLESFSKLK